MIGNENNILLSTFYLGESLWGINALDVQEVIRVPAITEVHNAPGYILGIINLRGRIVTVFDLSLRLGLDPLRVSEASRIVIVEWNDEYVGFLVDGFSDVIDIERSLLTSAPATMKGTRGNYLESVYQSGEQFVPILNTKEVLEITDDSSTGDSSVN